MTVNSVVKISWSWIEKEKNEIILEEMRTRSEELIQELATEALLNLELCNNPKLSCKLLKLIPVNLLSSPSIHRLLDCLQSRGLFSKVQECSKKETEKLIEDSLEDNEALAITLITRCKSKNMAHFLKACEYGQVEAMQAMLDQGLDCNLSDESTDKNPPLHQAVRFNQFHAAQFLLNNGAAVDRRDDQEMTALHIASFELNPITMKLLIDRQASVNIRNKHGNTPLHYSYKDAEAVKLLLDSGALPNITNEKGRTALHEIVFVNNIEGTKRLLERGFDPLLEDNDGKTPIDLSIGYNSHTFLKVIFAEYPLMRLIIQEMQNNNWQNKISNSATLIANDLHINPLEVAFLMKFNTTLVKKLVRYMSSTRVFDSLAQLVQKYPSYKDQLLLLACKSGHLQSVKMIFSFGANVNFQNSNKETSLHIASSSGNLEIAQFLLENNASPNVKNEEGAVPLHTATKNENLPLVELLITHKADCNIQNKEKLTPLHLCAGPKIIQLLLSAGAQLELKDLQGNTPLSSACSQSLEGAACELYRAGASLLEKNKKGHTPIKLAIEMNCRLFLSEVFINFGFIQGLLDNSDNIRYLESELINKVNLLMDRDGLIGDAIPLEVGLLFQNIPLVKAVLGQMTSSSIDRALTILKSKYPSDQIQFLQDCLFSVNKEHMLKGQDMDIDIPEAPAIELSVMLEMFDAINFTKPLEAGYRNPDRLKDDGCETSVGRLKEGLDVIITKTKKREAHLATPPSDTPQLLVFYGKLEKLLKHMAHALTTTTDLDTKSSVLIDLGVAGNHCGIRWMSESHQLYNLLCRPFVPLTLEDRFLGLLRRVRLGLIMEIADGNPHDYNYILSKIGEELGLTATETLQGYFDNFYRGSKNHQEFLDTFYSSYTSQRILDICKDEVERLYREFETRDIIISWIIENMPEEWGQYDFGPIHRTVQRLMLQEGKEDMIRSLLKKHQIFVQEGSSPLKAIHAARANEYLAREVFEKTADGTPTNKIRRDAVIRMLLRFNILQGLEIQKPVVNKPQSIAKRFKYTHAAK